MPFRAEAKPEESKSSAPASGGKGQPDSSLRPNPDSYVAEKGEFDKILRRISDSSSLVVGIAGVRGAGKSSLALKVLNECDDRGFFTLLIHSPTGYEHREFLLSIYQRICEATIQRLDQLLGNATTLTTRGRREARKVLRLAGFIMLGAFLLFLLPVGYAYYRFERGDDLSAVVAARQKQLETQRSNLETQWNKVREERSSLERKLAALDDEFSRFLRSTAPNNDNDINNVGGRPVPAPTPSADERAFLEDLLEERRKEKNPDREVLQVINELLAVKVHEAELERESRQVSWYEDLYLDRSLDLPSLMFRYATRVPVLLVIYVVLVACSYASWKLLRKYRLQRKYPKELGLYYTAKQTLEHLRYQTKLTSSQDASFEFWKLGAKLFKSKELETRPVSVPGLTAECSDFMEKVADVFGGKCVICLDELDKISEPEQLTELLKGVKGILGRQNTYFLLTVSEDALARFTARRRTERDIVESAFEEIVYLDRVSYATARRIVAQMLAVPDDRQTESFNKNCLLIWLFGSAIPREIKRNVVACQSDDVDVVTATPFVVWKALFTSLLSSLYEWALIVSKEEDEYFDFLRGLDESDDVIPSEPVSLDGAVAWYKKLAASEKLLQMAAPPPPSITPGNGDAARRGDALAVSMRRGSLELSIGALALWLINSSEEEIESQKVAAELLEIFKVVSYSPKYAAYRMRMLLGRMGFQSEEPRQNFGAPYF